jgi:hypothetical protein
VPNIAQHPSARSTKLLLIGESGSGKTGGLCSLAAAGYRLRIQDFDNGTEIMRNYLLGDTAYVKQCPGVAANVEYVTLTDPMRNIGGQISPLRATAWQHATQLLMHWRYWLAADGTVLWDKPKDDAGATLVDLGKIVDWTEQDVLVIDTLTGAASAALNFHLQMNGKLGQARTSNEIRRDIGAAQGHIRKLLELLYDESIKCNVIVNSHVTTVTESGLSPQSEDAKDERDTARGFPSAIGRALSPLIPRYFNSVLEADTVGSRHIIRTVTRSSVLCKTAAPTKVKAEYDLANGLAEYFKAVRA